MKSELEADASEDSNAFFTNNSTIERLDGIITKRLESVSKLRSRVIITQLALDTSPQVPDQPNFPDILSDDELLDTVCGININNCSPISSESRDWQ